VCGWVGDRQTYHTQRALDQQAHRVRVQQRHPYPHSPVLVGHTLATRVRRLLLATLTSRPVKFEKVRADSDEPGLRDYEVSFLRLLDKLCNGESSVCCERVVCASFLHEHCRRLACCRVASGLASYAIIVVVLRVVVLPRASHHTQSLSSFPPFSPLFFEHCTTPPSSSSFLLVLHPIPHSTHHSIP
jgi:hypothetical protein